MIASIANAATASTKINVAVVVLSSESLTSIVCRTQIPIATRPISKTVSVELVLFIVPPCYLNFVPLSCRKFRLKSV